MKTLVCFSGGRTSAYMSKIIKDMNLDDVVFVFANTGQERNETLDFVNKCDKQFGLGVVWVEAVVNEGRVACTHRIVTYETASRITDKDKRNSPFYKMCEKYGIPNKAYPHCTRELKENPIHSYLASIGWVKGEYQTAIGIRADEPKRIKRNATPQNKIYPLVDWVPSDRDDVMDFWSEQEFDLGLKDYEGNCAWCFKKSNKKLMQIIANDRSVFEFPSLIERNLGHVGPNRIGGELVSEPRTLYRQYMTADKLIALYDSDGNEYVKNSPKEEDGCGESCEAFSEFQLDMFEV